MEYFVFFALVMSIFLSLGRDNKSTWHALLTLVLITYLIMLAAFRDGEHMPDYSVYVQKYLMEAYGERSDLEPSFMIISRLSSLVSADSPYVMFLIYAVMGVLIKVSAIKKISSFFFLSLTVYISNFYILMEMIQIRIGVASAFVLLAMPFLYKRKFVPFFTLITIATFFHFSSLYAFVLWLVNPREFCKKRYILIIVAAYLFYIVSEVILGIIFSNLSFFPFLSRFAAYIDASEDGDLAINPLGIYAITRLIVVAYFVCCSKRIMLCDPYFVLILKIYILGLASYIGFALFPSVSYRLGQLFMLTEIFLIPMVAFSAKRISVGKLYVICWSLLSFIMNVLFTSFFKYDI